LSKGEINFVLLTSSNIARAFAAALDDKSREMIQSGRTKIVSISPVTSAVVRELGWSVAAEAREFTTEGVGQSLLELARVK
jgi:uroporphyrinogen III methyltransferase / synthase